MNDELVEAILQMKCKDMRASLIELATYEDDTIRIAIVGSVRNHRGHIL